MKERKQRNAEKSTKGKQSEKLKGNQNARTSEHGSMVVRLMGTDVDLLFDFFASEGNMDPTSADFAHAIHYALGQVYSRKIEHDQATIL
jgi:hypothetical protein